MEQIYHYEFNDSKKYFKILVEYESINDCYINLDIKKVLYQIGKAIIPNDDFTDGQVYGIIANEANKLIKGSGKYRNRFNRITNLQVKSVVRAFKKFNSKNQYYIKIPYSIIPILYTIIKLLHEKCNYDFLISSNEIKDLNKISFGEALYNEHITQFNKNNTNHILLTEDSDERDRIIRLSKQLLSKNSFVNCTLKSVDWEYNYYDMK